MATGPGEVRPVPLPSLRPGAVLRCAAIPSWLLLLLLFLTGGGGLSGILKVLLFLPTPAVPRAALTVRAGLGIGFFG